MSAKKIQYRFYTLTFPSEFTIEQTLDFFDSVSTALSRGSVIKQPEYIVLELWSDKYGLKHRLGIPWEQSGTLTQQLLTLIQGVRIEEDRRDVIPKWTHVVEVGVSDNTRLFKIERAESQVKRLLASAIADPKSDDILLIQWVVAPGDNIKPPPLSREVRTSHVAFDLLWNGRKAEKDEVIERRANAAQNQFRAVLRVAATSSTLPHAKKRVDNVRAAYKVPETASVHFTERWWLPKSTRIERVNRAAGPGLPYSFLNATEVAVFSTWPIGNPSVPGLTVENFGHLPPVESLPQDGIHIGKSSASGYKNRMLALSPEDLFRSVWILGPTGTGKTTLTENLTAQVIDRGWSANVFETKGDLFYRLLDDIHRDHADNVIVIDLTDRLCSVGLNVLHDGDARSTIDTLINLFIKGTPDPKLFNEAAFHGLHTLRLIPGTTVIDLVPLLDPQTDQEKAWKGWVIDQVPRGSALAQYWRREGARTDKDRRNRVQPVLNRLWKFDSNDSLRHFLGQSQSTFSLRDAVIEGKSIFIYAPYQIGSEQVTLFLSLMANQIWNTIQETKGLKKVPTAFIADEMQRLNDMPIDLADMVTLQRSYESFTIGAHQYMGQLSPALLQAMTAMGTKISYRLDGPDARAWQSIIGKGITPDNVMNLRPYEAIARMAHAGGVSPPVSVATFEPPTKYGLKDHIIARSREKYARSVTEIEREIQSRRTAPSKPAREKPSFGYMKKEGE